MVNYWATDYLGQIRALDIARSVHGDLRRMVSSPAGLAYAGFQTGGLCLRWLRMAATKTPPDEIERAVLECQGLALSVRGYAVSGRLLELWSELQAGSVNLADLMHGSLHVGTMLGQFFEGEYREKALACMVEIGLDLELLLFWVEGLIRRPGVGQVLPKLESVFDTAGVNVPWLQRDFRGELLRFRNIVAQSLQSGKPPALECLSEATKLQNAITERLRTLVL
jgi:hypothetical protein